MLLKNALAVLEQTARKADIRIQGERIRQISAAGEALSPAAGEEVLDLSGKVVLPGGIDAHTHLDLDLGAVRSTDDFFTGTVAAACGGTTTVIDHMAFGPRGCSIRHQLDVYHSLAEGKAVIDYGFHGVTDHADDSLLTEMKALIHEGVTSHKIYLTYGGKVSDYEAMKLLRFAAETGVLIAVHAENDGAIEYLRESCLAGGQTAPRYHAVSRPVECEAEAVSRMVFFAQMAGDAPLYIVHLSGAPGLEAIRAARARGQRRLFAETCPQYLLLDESLYDRADGLKYVMSPPLRAPEHQAALWGGIASGDIDVIATDHCPFFFHKEKQLGKTDFSKTPGGAPGVEARMPLLFSEAARGRLSLEKMVDLCCTRPARLFGLYPRKGIIAPGSDADLAVFDPDLTVTLSHELLHEHTDYTPYEGMKLTGYPVLTFSRGEVIFRDGRFCGQKGRGRFLQRGLMNG